LREQERVLLYELERGERLWPRLQGIAPGATVAIAVGPEGGFVPEEIERAETTGVAVVGVGELVLRAETAGIVACALAMSAAGC
jgi:16S rRNA (uracil1498-N3)-methyltransferase